MKALKCIAICCPNTLVLVFALAVLFIGQAFILPSYFEAAVSKLFAILMIIFNFSSFGMFCWCWFTTAFTDPGRVKDSLARRGLLKNIQQGDIPYFLQHLKICPKCQVPVPARAYHCDFCECCCLRHDHHCGVVGACIADRNMKSFVLSFFYASIFGFGVFISTLWSLLSTGFNIISMIGCLYGGILGILLLGFGCSFANASFETFSHTKAKAKLSLKRGFYLLMETFGPTWKERLLPNYLYETEYAWPEIEFLEVEPLL